VQARGFSQVSDTGALDGFVQQVLAANPDLVARIQAGEAKVVNVLVGQIMKASGGKANPKRVSELLAQVLG
jgi:aspartyl-tRNA(Asn)/glutamyl-tRNA(Gln) amidotransferase subunit B